jgi:hypothetical protein
MIGAGMLAMTIPACSFAQTASNPANPSSVTAGAANAVPGITNDTVSASGGNSSTTSVRQYADTTAAATVPPAGFPPNASMMKMPSSGQSGEFKPTIQELNYGTKAERRLYARAVAAFPTFCEDWAHKLRVRETDNLNSLNFQEKSGYETASYVGYGPIKSCECKESAEGIPLGKVTYDEENFFLEGKSVDEAKHNAPKLVGITHTLEIFSWDQNKWFY